MSTDQKKRGNPNRKRGRGSRRSPQTPIALIIMGKGQYVNWGRKIRGGK